MRRCREGMAQQCGWCCRTPSQRGALHRLTRFPSGRFGARKIARMAQLGKGLLAADSEQMIGPAPAVDSRRTTHFQPRPSP